MTLAAADPLPDDPFPDDQFPDDQGSRDEDAAASAGSAQSAASPGTRSTFLEPWLPRVRDIDRATLDELLRFLVQLRRIKFALTGTGLVAGALSLGFLPIANPVHILLIYGTLAVLGGLPVLGTGTLAVRRLFLKEAERQGLSKSAAMLVLTRAERAARFMRPLRGMEAQVAALREAVRDWDRA